MNDVGGCYRFEALRSLPLFRAAERLRMAENTTKEKILEAVQKLPPDATIEDAMERLFFLAKVERGIAEADAGKTIPHEEAKQRLTR